MILSNLRNIGKTMKWLLSLRISWEINLRIVFFFELFAEEEVKDGCSAELEKQGEHDLS